MANTRGKRKETTPVDEAMVATEEIIAEPATPENKKGVVACSKLNVREAASTESAILSVISENDVVEILDDTNVAWYKVSVDGIGTGFCMKEFIKVIE